MGMWQACLHVHRMSRFWTTSQTIIEVPLQFGGISHSRARDSRLLRCMRARSPETWFPLEYANAVKPVDENRDALRHWTPKVLGVVAASLVVALGAAGFDLLVPPAELGEDRVRTVRVLAAVAALVGLVLLLVQRRRLRSRRQRQLDPDPAGRALLFAAGTMALLALIALYVPSVDLGGGGPSGDGGLETRWGDDSAESQPLPPPAAPPPPSDAPAEIVDSPEVIERAELEAEPPPELGDTAVETEPPARSFDWSILAGLSVLLSWILLAGLIGIGLWVLARRGGGWRGFGRDGEEAHETVVGDEEAEAGLEASLGEFVDLGGDPRMQITAAYRHLLAALAAADAPRRPEEAPHEHLRRALGPLGLRREPLHRLAELYIAAEFGERPITAAHRSAAIRALERGLADLRAARTPIEAEA
ncbi:MAG: DUF4129 domain-containing protein [Gemmatimonadales bacterium]|nr:MAG: DUF4129 domain-containing protein [Gemmatimonadales bacterium]